MNTQHQTPEPSPTAPPFTLKPKPRKHRRNGNIARLPKLERDLDKYLRVIRTLCRLSREIFRLQKYRDDCARSVKESPEAIKKEDQEFFATVRQDYGPNSKLHLDPQMKDRDPEPAAQPGSTPASDAVPAAEKPDAGASESSYIILQPDGSRKFSGIAYLQHLMEAEKASRESKPTPTSAAPPVPPKPVCSPLS